MKLNLTKQWCVAAAQREGDSEVGAGRVARDPLPELPEASVHVLPTEPMQLAFGKLIAQLRRKNRWTAEQLSDKAEVDLAEIVLIEHDPHHRVEPRTIYKLASVFRLNVKSLMQLSGLARPRDQSLVTGAVRFAANSDSVDKLSPDEMQAVDQFVALLNQKVES